MGPFVALALNGFREARRNRVTLLVAIFALAMLLSTSLVLEVTVGTFDRVITDVGLGAMSLMLVLLTVFLSSGLISREIERRTIFLMVSKPISRGAFLVGRLLGNMLTGAISWKWVSGPFTIASYAGQSAQVGWKAFLTFLALVSISLGVMNLLPIPVLDGGHLMY